MSVIIRLQNLPWSANALDIRNFFRGLSIPEGGVHIVGGELGDAFIAFSTDEDARQAMMLDCGKLKEIQVKLLLSSRSEMHKVIETARQSVPILQLTAPAPAPAPVVAAPAPAPVLTPFAAALAGHAALGIPGIGNPLEVPQPAVIEPPAPLAPSPPTIITPADPAPEVHDIDTRDSKDTKENRKRNKDKRRTRSKSRSRSSSRSRSRDKKDRRRDRRDRSRSRDRRRRNRSRSRDRKDRRRDRKERSRSRDRVSPWNRGEGLRKQISPPKKDLLEIKPDNQGFGSFGPSMMMMGNGNGNVPRMLPPADSPGAESFDKALSRLQELGKKRNPEAFQGSSDMMNGGPRGFNGGPPAGNQRLDPARRPRFEAGDDNGCCVAIRGVPTHTSYGDLRRFFPFMIDKHGIKMINDQLGRRTGTVLVRFVEPRSKALALHRRNNELKGAEVRVEHLPDEEFDAAVDSFLPVRHDPPPAPLVPAPAPEPLAEPDAPQEPFTVLRLEDLPLFVKEHDIIKAFSEFSLLSIMMAENRATRTRSACVQFVKADDAREALARRDRLVFARRPATVSALTDDEYNKEKQAQLEREAPAPLPERLPPPQFQRAVSPAGPPAPQPPQLQPDAPRDPRQRRPPQDAPLLQPGAPYFQPDFAQQSMMPLGFQAQPFGGFPGAVGAGGIGGDPRDPRRRNNMPPMAMPRSEDDDTLDCVLMKGLPRDASDRDIVEFLQETGAVPARIHLMLDVGGAPSGDCFCEFRSEDEARRAARRHGAKLQGCRISVDPVPRAVVLDALAPEPAGPAPALAPLGFPPRDLALMGDAPPFFDPQQRGGFGPGGPDGPGGPGGPRAPYRSRGGSIFERGGFGRGANRGRGSYDRGGANFGGPSFGRGNDNFDRNGGGGFNRDDEDFDRGKSFDRGNGGFDRGGRGGFDRGGRGFGARGFEPRGRGRGFGRGRGGGTFESERPQNSPGDEQDPLDDFGAPGCVVSMENVPFRASVEDILIFFGDFNLSTDDVIRRFNERGQPTGDARVAFRTPFDAQRAVAAKHMQQIQDRRVALALL